MVEGNELVLAPFQGPIACTRIRFGRGVCGTAWKEAQTLIVPDVELFPGHIACSSDSRSEIVVPIIKEGNVIGVLDIDSDSTGQHLMKRTHATWKKSARTSDMFSLYMYGSE